MATSPNSVSGRVVAIVKKSFLINIEGDEKRNKSQSEGV